MTTNHGSQASEPHRLSIPVLPPPCGSPAADEIACGLTQLCPRGGRSLDERRRWEMATSLGRGVERRSAPVVVSKRVPIASRCRVTRGPPDPLCAPTRLGRFLQGQSGASHAHSIAAAPPGVGSRGIEREPGCLRSRGTGGLQPPTTPPLHHSTTKHPPTPQASRPPGGSVTTDLLFYRFTDLLDLRCRRHRSQ
jgi:hypothetical protein